jgi:uncharacterized protein
MRWRGRRTSSNIEDRRRGGRRRPGDRRRRPRHRAPDRALLRHRRDARSSTRRAARCAARPSRRRGPNTIDDEIEEFVAVVLADTEEVWADIFQANGLAATGRRASSSSPACPPRPAAAPTPRWARSTARATAGLPRHRLLPGARARLGARGEFARAYVIAHEVAHHVQAELGLLGQVHARRRASASAEAQPPLGAGRAAGRLLCRPLGAPRRGGAGASLEPGDIEAALDAASAIGDDALQRAKRGVVVPDSFTHGSSAQRSAGSPAASRPAIPAPATPSPTEEL